MPRSRFGWALCVVAPWCLGLGLVVSCTADAGIDASMGATRVMATNVRAAMPADLVPARSRAVVDTASLVVGPAQEFRFGPDEIQPRTTLKRRHEALPALDRSHKGDPFVPLRPTFDARLRARGIAGSRIDAVVLTADTFLAFNGFAPAAGAIAGPDSVETFEPSADFDDDGATAPSGSKGASPAPAGSAATLRSGGTTPRIFDGSTPAIPRAVALASTTPAPADATPIEVVSSGRAAVAALGGKSPETSLVPRSTDRPDFAAMFAGERGAQELHCLAQAVYFEARSEPEDGQAAVAQVVLNRVASGLYPSSVCAVVYQNRQHHNACQFSFACDGKALRTNESEPWRTAQRIAKNVADGQTYVADVGGATHYHANYVRPRWARYLKRMDTIGHHIFYELRPGQT